MPLSSRLPKVAAKDNTGSRAAEGAAPAVSGAIALDSTDLLSHMCWCVGADSSKDNEDMPRTRSRASEAPKVAAKDNTGSRAAEGAAPADSGAVALDSTDLLSHVCSCVDEDFSDDDEEMPLSKSGASKAPKVAAKDNTGSKATLQVAPDVAGVALLAHTPCSLTRVCR